MIPNFKIQRPASTNPVELLRQIICRGGPADAVGTICQSHPDAARWLIKRADEIEEIRSQQGRPPGRFDAYQAAARQALARREGLDWLDRMDGEDKA